MKLYTRLIEEGVFIFWSSDEGNTSYNLKIRIAVGDDKVELVNLNIPKGQNYFSFDKIGSGDYEIELNGYKDNRLYQTETKKMKIISSAQKITEITDKLAEIDLALITLDLLKVMRDDIENLCGSVSNINAALTDPKTMRQIRNEIESYEQWGF